MTIIVDAKLRLPAIERPNGKLYRPRKITAEGMGSEDEICSIVVFGTHDPAFAKLHAIAEAERLANETYSNEYRLELTDGGAPVWYRQDLSHFEDNQPHYCFCDDPERGRAGVRFNVEEVEVEA